MLINKIPSIATPLKKSREGIRSDDIVAFIDVDIEDCDKRGSVECKVRFNAFLHSIVHSLFFI